MHRRAAAARYTSAMNLKPASLLLAWLSLPLAGCGNKGPLVLPQDPPPAEASAEADLLPSLPPMDDATPPVDTTPAPPPVDDAEVPPPPPAASDDGNG